MIHIKRYLIPYSRLFIGNVDCDHELSTKFNYSSTLDLGQEGSRKRNGKYMYDGEHDVLVERCILGANRMKGEIHYTPLAPLALLIQSCG